MRNYALYLAILGLYVLSVGAVFAQSFVQFEAHSTLREAQERARLYGQNLPDVVGFRLRSGWYALALGPYSDNRARQVLLNLRRSGIIPRDAYVEIARTYGDQFWPAEGARSSAATIPTAPAEPLVPLKPSRETPNEARASEALLSRDQKRDLQTAMQWFGFYDAAIDGSFGRGTRRSMAAWQDANRFEATGILTSNQRRLLSSQYREALNALGLQKIRDETAGLTITAPTNLVKFSSYETPFARYTPKGDSDVQMLLISQFGDTRALFGLYEIMQTLEIVPPDGERRKGRDDFVLTGQSDALHSYTYARALPDGTIKGFTLVYPPTRASEMARVIPIMQDSLNGLPGALDLSHSSDDEQSIDLISGLELRRPKLSSSGFYVRPEGHVLTHAGAVASCTQITIDGTHEAEIIAAEGAFALLQSTDELAPLNYARFAPSVGRLRSSVAVSGYSYGGALGSATLTFGTLEDVRGLRGEDDISRLGIDTLPGDAGGPVLTEAGSVSGMLLPEPGGNRSLPDQVQFAAKGRAIAQFLVDAGIQVEAATNTAPLVAEDLDQLARDITVQIGCW